MPRQKESDRELRLLAIAVGAFEELNDEQRRRALVYLEERFGPSVVGHATLEAKGPCCGAPLLPESITATLSH